MARDDMVTSVTKTVDITFQAAKITADILQKGLQEFLNGKAIKRGKMTMRQLGRKSGKLESIEVTDNNIRDFLNTAKKYDVDFALKRDRSTSPATYHVFFQADKAENINRAFAEYALKKSKQIASQKAPFSRQKLREAAEQQAKKQRNNVREHDREQKREEVR